MWTVLTEEYARRWLWLKRKWWWRKATRTTSLIMNWSQIVTSCIKLNPVV